jgi:hypothetical protein
MAYFQTKNTNLGKFWRVWQWKMLDYFMYWYILLDEFEWCGHLVYCMVEIFQFFPRFGMSCQKNMAALVYK